MRTFFVFRQRIDSIADAKVNPMNGELTLAIVTRVDWIANALEHLRDFSPDEYAKIKSRLVASEAA